MKRSPLNRKTPLRRTGWPKKSGVAKRKGYGQTWVWCMDRANRRCEARTEVCAGHATQVHHVLPRGRGGDDDLGNLLAVCLPCHSHIHAHPVESLERGWLRSRKAAA